ncbi:MAG: YbaK/EbsC family protein [Gaiellaceae bacterium]
MTVTRTIDASVGDTVEVSGRRVGDHARRGEILEVLGEGDRAHYRVRWEDGHETVLYPGEGTTFRGADPPTAIPPAAVELVDVLREAGVEFELLPHPRTETARGEAVALGVVPQAVAKTIVVCDETGARVRAVIPASSRLVLADVAEAIGAKTVELVHERDLVDAYPGFELGAVPPFGGPDGELAVVDRRLAESEHVVLEAGVHDTSLRMRTEDLLTVADAKLAEIAEDQ